MKHDGDVGLYEEPIVLDGVGYRGPDPQHSGAGLDGFHDAPSALLVLDDLRRYMLSPCMVSAPNSADYLTFVGLEVSSVISYGSLYTCPTESAKYN